MQFLTAYRVLVWVLVSVTVGVTSTAGTQDEGVGERAKPSASDLAALPWTHEPGAALQMRLELIGLQVTAEEVSRINKSAVAFDVAALAKDVIKRGDAKVKCSVGGPVVLHHQAKMVVAHNIPFVTSSKPSGKGNSVLVTAISREDVGGIIQVHPQPCGKEVDAISVSFDLEFSLVSENAKELAPGVNSPVFSELSQEFSARIPLGRDVYFWSFSSSEPLGSAQGAPRIYVTRVRFDRLLDE